MKQTSHSFIIRDCCNCLFFQKIRHESPCNKCMVTIQDPKSQTVNKVLFQNWSGKRTTTRFVD